MASPDCLDPDIAAAFVSNALSGDESARVERHIDECTACRELLSLVAKSAWSTSSGPTLQSPPSQQPMAPQPGRRPRPTLANVLPRAAYVGPFEVRHLLSSGGMGVVYVAYDARLDRQLALKCVGDRHGDAQQLLNEARLMAQASHPNVVPVYDVIEAEGQLYIAMELVVGRTVGQWMAGAPHGWRDVVDLFLEAGKGLAAAHSLGIVHGDVKPGNILVGDDGRVRVSDFGIASFASDSELLTGLVRGTPAYFAPEQKSGAPADFRSDQYAFAVSLHEALFGALPTEPATRRTRLPFGVRRVLARALAKSPAERFGSMDEFLRSLRAARARRGRLVAVGAATLVLLAALSFVFGGQRAEAAQCAAATAALKSPWAADTRARSRAAFERTALPFAADTFTRTDAALTVWSSAFGAAVAEACGQPRFAQRLSCLESAARDARALVTQLVDADAAMVLRAVAAAEGLPPTAQCGAERAAPVPSSGPAADAVKDELAKARALAAGGRYREAAQTAEAAAKAAEATGNTGLIALAKADWGGDLTLVDRFDDAIVVLADAVRLAELAQDDRARSRAWCDLVGVEYSRGHHDQVLLFGPIALGAAQRIGDVRHETEMMITIGSSLAEKGRAAEGRAMLEEAVKLREKAWGPRDRRTSMALSSLANMMAMGGDLKGAQEAHRRALEAAAAAFGPDHPETAIIRLNLGDDHLYGLEVEQAIPNLEAAVAGLSRARGPRGLDALSATTDLGFAYLLSGRRDDALTTFEGIVPAWAEAFPKHPVRAMALLGRYRALAATGGRPAVADLELALTLSGDLPPFETGRVQLEAALAKNDAKLLASARENLRSIKLPLVEAELQRANGAAVR